MRIASVTNTPLDPALGSGKTVINWTTELRRLGHEVTVFSPENFYHPWPRDKGRRLKLRLDALRLEVQIIDGRFDLVEFYGAEFGLLIRRLARRSARPLLVAHTNGLELVAFAPGTPGDEPLPRGVFQRAVAKLIEPFILQVNRWAFEKVDAFAAICQTDVDYIVKHGHQPHERCASVEPGLDVAFLNAPWDQEKHHRIVCLGSWTARKDPETLMAAAKHIMLEDSKVEFHVLGAWSSKARILEILPSEFHPRTIIYPKVSQNELVKILSESKVFIFPSIYEGFGMATTEAMACGCAVVVTPTGFGASIQNGVDGFVCPFGDAAALSLATKQLLSDEALRSRLASAGRKRVSELTWQAQTEKLAIVYRNWLSELA